MMAGGVLILMVAIALYVVHKIYFPIKGLRRRTVIGDGREKYYYFKDELSETPYSRLWKSLLINNTIYC